MSEEHVHSSLDKSFDPPRVILVCDAVMKGRSPQMVESRVMHLGESREKHEVISVVCGKPHVKLKDCPPTMICIECSMRHLPEDVLDILSRIKVGQTYRTRGTDMQKLAGLGVFELEEE